MKTSVLRTEIWLVCALEIGLENSRQPLELLMLLAKQGNTRSIGIIESGGILIQARNFNSDIFFPELSDLITLILKKNY